MSKDPISLAGLFGNFSDGWSININVVGSCKRLGVRDSLYEPQRCLFTAAAAVYVVTMDTSILTALLE